LCAYTRHTLGVMAGLVPAIHDFGLGKAAKTWMPGIKPGMTVERFYARALTHAPLIPAHAGIQSDDFRVGNWRPWTPAFAGVSGRWEPARGPAKSDPKPDPGARLSGRWEPALAVTPPRF